MPEPVDEAMARQALEMNKTLPVMIDDNSRLDEVAYKDRTFTHFYTVVGISNKAFLEAYPLDVLKDFFAANACNDENARNSMHDGVVFAYRFRSEGGEQLAHVDVSIGDCNGS